MFDRIRMMSFCLLGGVTIGASEASTIVPLTADRSVGVSVDMVDGEVQSFDEDSAFSDTLDPFNETVVANGLIAPCIGTGTATHVSDITPLSITGTADLTGSVEIPAGASLTGASISGGANLTVTFAIAEPTAFTLIANASATPESPNSVQGVTLTGPGGSVVSAEGVDSYIANVNMAGVLAPGEYELHVYFILTSDAVNLNGPAITEALGHFDVNLQVPEPSSLLVLGMFGLLAARRR